MLDVGPQSSMKSFFTSVVLLLIGSVVGGFFGCRFHERYVADGGQGADMKALLIIVGTAAVTLFTFRAFESLVGLMLAQPHDNRKDANTQYLIAVLVPAIYFLRTKKWISFITAFLLLGSRLFSAFLDSASSDLSCGHCALSMRFGTYGRRWQAPASPRLSQAQATQGSDSPKKRIEPMTNSAIRRALHRNSIRALLVTAHPGRWAKLCATPSP